MLDLIFQKRCFSAIRLVSNTMRTSYFLQEGQVIRKSDRKDGKSDGLFSIDKLIKKLLTAFHVAHFDDCCEVDPNSAPVRFNTETSKLQRFNTSTKAWVDINAL
jgi:hypothetical protein